MSPMICVICGFPADGEHHLIAKTLLKTLPNLTPDDMRMINDLTVPTCRHHHNLLDEVARMYVHLIRCALEGRPYRLSTTLLHRRANIESFSENNRVMIMEKLDSIYKLVSTSG